MATVLVIGSGGREHAIVRKLAESPRVERIVAAPGNPGIEAHAEVRPVAVGDLQGLRDLAAELRPDLIVIGPENPIADGLSDMLRYDGHLVFAPSRNAARLESEKSFAKSFMERHAIPTARSRTFTKEGLLDGKAFLDQHPLPVVLKASGLAAGKGVIIAEDHREALHAFVKMITGESFGDAGSEVVVEEYMEGEEASIFAICDGIDYILLAAAQDHKRIGDDDTGPNTGGMGAYAPAPVVTPEIMERIARTIIEPTLRGMREEGTPYQGCLFVGVMIDRDGDARVVEFNCRFGDPEAQVILPIWRGDLYELFHAAASGTIATVADPGSSGSAVCVVLASGGYPESYRSGMPIDGLDDVAGRDDVVVYHAGTKREGERIVTAGGRVLGVTAIGGEDLEGGIAAAYDALSSISFEGMVYRHDIGRKGIAAREKTS